MIAGAGNFPSGRFRCETSFLDFNIAGDFQKASGEKYYVVENKRKIVNRKAVIGAFGGITIRESISMYRGSAKPRLRRQPGRSKPFRAGGGD
jgi:hypothetical protein